MENRPFYELDEEETVLEEAAIAALSDVAPRQPLPIARIPTLTLHTNFGPAQLKELRYRLDPQQPLTLLDHAYLVNQLACTLNDTEQDQFGFAAALRTETAFLCLDLQRCASTTRSERAPFPHEGVAQFSSAPLDYSERAPAALARSFERDALKRFSQEISSTHPFFAFRRLALALLPQLTKSDTLTDTLNDYAIRARVFMNAAAAKSSFLAWGAIAKLSDPQAEHAARQLLEALTVYQLASPNA